MDSLNHPKKRHHNILISFCLVIFLLLILIFMSNDIEIHNYSEQQMQLEKIIRRDIVHCYATEGKYPESLEYLKLHYGLNYDPDVFFVDYIPIGSNLMPDFTVIYKGSKND